MANKVQPGSVAQVVALANRFLALKSSPGFHDLRLLCEMLEREATAQIVDYPGFDKEEMASLKSRAQAAKELVTEIFGRIETAIGDARGLPGFQAEQPGEPLTTERIAGSY